MRAVTECKDKTLTVEEKRLESNQEKRAHLLYVPSDLIKSGAPFTEIDTTFGFNKNVKTIVIK